MLADSPFAKMDVLSNTQHRIEFWAILGCFVLLLTLVELVRRKRLKEKYSLLWFMTCGVLFVLTIRRDWLETMSRWAGIYYPPSALFLVLVFFLILILMHFSTVISELLNDKQVLAQHVAILEAKLGQLEKYIQAQISRGEETSNNED